MAGQQETGTMMEVVLSANIERLKQGLQEQQWTKAEIVKSAFLAVRHSVWDCLCVLLDHGFPVNRYVSFLDPVPQSSLTPQALN